MHTEIFHTCAFKLEVEKCSLKKGKLKILRILISIYYVTRVSQLEGITIFH